MSPWPVTALWTPFRVAALRFTACGGKPVVGRGLLACGRGDADMVVRIGFPPDVTRDAGIGIRRGTGYGCNEVWQRAQQQDMTDARQDGEDAPIASHSPGFKTSAFMPGCHRTKNPV